VGSVIGEILPLAVGIAISPIPIIAVILMLLSPRAKGTSVGFMIGWLLGIVIAIIAYTLLSSVIPQRSEGGSSVAGVIKIILGVLLLFLAFRQWRARPAQGEEASLPKWMSAIDSMTIFVLLAACTVIIPVIAYLIAASQLAGPLDKLRGWLVENNATIMSALLLVIGVAVIGKGLGNF
jgi:predicted membrane channel-forming protein YqfA (hemolysin III family)